MKRLIFMIAINKKNGLKLLWNEENYIRTANFSEQFVSSPIYNKL